MNQVKHQVELNRDCIVDNSMQAHNNQAAMGTGANCMVPVQLHILEYAVKLGIKPPEYATAYSAAVDLAAALAEPMTLKVGQRALIPTGLQIALPPYHEAQIRPRSGLSLKHGITVLNSPGTIDADYRGEIKVILINHGEEDFTIAPLTRIAQMLVSQVLCFNWQLEPMLIADVPTVTGANQRGSGGFGSTGW